MAASTNTWSSDYPLCRGELDKLRYHDECHYQERYSHRTGKDEKQGCIWARKCFVESYNKKQLEDLMR